MIHSDLSNRSILRESKEIALVPYLHEDDPELYSCWKDMETQKGFNYLFNESYDDFQQENIDRFLFFNSVVSKKEHIIIGAVRLSPPEYPPDLAIWIYPPYRNKGYGTKAFILALDFCFTALKLEKVFARCFENNPIGLRMLQRIGFVRDASGDTEETDVLNGKTIMQYNFYLTRRPFRKTLT